MAENEIEEMLDHLRRIKSGGNLDSAKIYQIKEFEMVLRIWRTFIKYHHVLICGSLVQKYTNNVILTMAMLSHVLHGIPDECITTNLELRFELYLLEFLERITILSYNHELNDFDLSKYMDCVGKNLNDVLMMLGEKVRTDPRKENLETHTFIKELKFVQKKLRFLTYIYATEINGYVDSENMEYLETQMQFMANNVGQICLDFLGCVVSNSLDEDEEEVKYEIFSKPPCLLGLIVLVELEMKKIFLSELKAS